MSLLFVGLIGLPLFSQVLGWGQAGEAENRRMSERPTLPGSLKEWRSFPQKFEVYYDDHFAFRPWLIRTYNRIMVFGLGMSSSDEVLKGKKGWYFYTGSQLRHEDPLLDYSATQPLSESHLERWQNVLEERRDWLAERDIAYLVVLVPNKARIYPEYLPRGLQQGKEPVPYDQLVNHFAKNSTLNILDLTAALQEAKSIQRLYHKTDPHWNAMGGFVGYREVVKALPSCGLSAQVPLSLDDMVVETKKTLGGALSRLMGVEGLIEEEEFDLKQTKPLLATQEKVDGPDWTYLTRVNNPELPSGMVVGDSFIGGLAPFISEHFKWFIYNPTYNKFHPDYIAQHKPDMVIEEVVERFFRDRISNPPSLVAQRP